MEDIIVPIGICGFLFIGLPWLILHYMTKMKQSRSLSLEDENLMDELYDVARRLSERVETVERIVAAENPGFRVSGGRPAETYSALADESRSLREDDLMRPRQAEARGRFERR